MDGKLTPERIKEMTAIGDKIRGKDIGKPKNDWYIWTICPSCGGGRWVIVYASRLSCYTGFCFPCLRKARGPANHNWKGGRHKGPYGSILIWLSFDDFFYPMANKKGNVLEHRLVMAKALGRNLHLWEIVHHKNGIRDDNRLENLQLVSDDRHKQITILERRIRELEEKNILLEEQLARRERLWVKN